MLTFENLIIIFTLIYFKNAVQKIYMKLQNIFFSRHNFYGKLTVFFYLLCSTKAHLGKHKTLNKI